jgi:hypothetical protein
MFRTNRFREYLIIEPLRSSGCFPDRERLPACRRYVIATASEPMGVEAAVVRADWLAVNSMWVATTALKSSVI